MLSSYYYIDHSVFTISYKEGIIVLCLHFTNTKAKVTQKTGFELDHVSCGVGQVSHRQLSLEVIVPPFRQPSLWTMATVGHRSHLGWG